MKKIDTSKIDRTAFYVKVDADGRTLIVPKDIKHKWTEDEFHLRSLLLDRDGYVISSGWPKFFNYGERPGDDLEFVQAFNEKRVSLRDKLDGSLIIVDNILGEPHLRTRGAHSLGGFEDQVMGLVNRKYPELLVRLKEDLDAKRFSFLFEYTTPEQIIVVRYGEAALAFLGMVDKETLKPIVSEEVLAEWSEKFGIPVVESIPLEGDFDQALEKVKKWKDVEGVVAYYERANGDVRLVKMKCDWYRLLHSMKDTLSGDKLRKFCYLENIQSEEELQDKLYALGLDYEGFVTILDEYRVYDEERKAEQAMYEEFKEEIVPQLGEHMDRKAFALYMKELCGPGKKYPQSYFNFAMSIAKGQEEQAQLGVDAKVLRCGVGEITHWKKTYGEQVKELSEARPREGKRIAR